MLVPVSPSGTGKTLSLLISSALSATADTAMGKQVRMVFAIISTGTFISSMQGYANGGLR